MEAAQLSRDDELDVLMQQLESDGMVLRRVRVQTGDVVFFKSIVEAYPGIASVHARRGRVQGEHVELVVASPRGFASEVDSLLSELDLAARDDWGML